VRNGAQLAITHILRVFFRIRFSMVVEEGGFKYALSLSHPRTIILNVYFYNMSLFYFSCRFMDTSSRVMPLLRQVNAEPIPPRVSK
jgi:hypothetical protein